MIKIVRRVAGIVATFVVSLTLAAGVATWLIAHDEVSQLRVALRTTQPVPPLVKAAIAAAEDPLLDLRPRLSFRALLPPGKNTVSCGPSPIAYVVVRMVSPQRRALRWHIETAVTTYVVASIFSSDELLRIYASAVYFGRLDERTVTGVEDAGSVYFHKAARDLTVAEAATIAAMIRSPNVYSPLKYPARALDRRNKVLQRMHQLGSIDDRQWHHATGQPLRNASGA